MKMDFCGTGNRKDVLKVYWPGELPPQIEDKVNDLIFPTSLPAQVRDKEIQLYDTFKNRQVIFISEAGSCYPQKIVATCRLFFKNNDSEKLPVEFSNIHTITSRESTVHSYLHGFSKFSTDRFPAKLPTVEIGCLRAANIDYGSGISPKVRYRAIISVLTAAERIAVSRGIEACFLTCLGSQDLQKIYKEKFLFEELADITYSDPQKWSGKAL